MMTLKTVRKMQDARKPVELDDGRIGKIVRVDTLFPGNHTVVSVYMLGEGPGIAKVTLDRLVEARTRPPASKPTASNPAVSKRER